MESNRTVGYGIKAAWHTISRMYNSYAVDNDISISMGFVLMILDRNQGTPSTHIAPSIGMESRSLTRLLKSMEEKGLIEKTNDEIDKRQVLVTLTKKGEEKKAIAKETIKKFNKLVELNVSEKELNVFFSVLEKVNQLAEQNHLNTTHEQID